MQPKQPQKQLSEPCKQCGTVAWERLDRRGFLQEKVLPFFNLYPWRCALCNTLRYFPLRYDAARTRQRMPNRG